jgi:hypothetical protein
MINHKECATELKVLSGYTYVCTYEHTPYTNLPSSDYKAGGAIPLRSGVVLGSGLPDGLFSNQKSQFGYIL